MQIAPCSQSHLVLQVLYDPLGGTEKNMGLQVNAYLNSFLAFCRFRLPFLLPLLDAASRCRLAKQNHCALQYRRPIADVEGIGEFKLVSHCSLLLA
jgi:hypothetical protein